MPYTCFPIILFIIEKQNSRHKFILTCAWLVCSQLTMARYGRNHNTSFYFCFFLCSYPLIPMALSELSSTQKTTMINISNSLNSTGSSVSWNMHSEPNPCLWKGVECNPPNSSVTQISLSTSSLSSSDFLPIVCQLESLQVLDVSENYLRTIPSGFLTACGKLDGLKLLNFSFNNLVGSLPAFVGFSGLESLDLSHNNLSQGIDSELGGLVALRCLNLSFNFFSGTIPNQLGKPMLLEKLVFSANKFQGIIPGEIVDYHNLTLIDLSANHLSGSVPKSFGKLSRLEVLNLSSNNLSGKIPNTIGSMNSLLELQLSQNFLSGEIPRMPTSLQIALNLSSNLFEGPIPHHLSTLTGLEILDLSNNKFSGQIPSFLADQLVALTQLILSNNQLTGVVPRFNSWVMVDRSGNRDLINASSLHLWKGNSMALPIALAAVGGVLAGVSITILAILLSRHR